MKPRHLVILLAAAAIVGIAAVLTARALADRNGLRAFGTIEARNIHVGSKVGGRVTEVLVRPGGTVDAGQVLVRFDDRELRAALEQARATLQKLERGYRPEEIDEARAAAAQAKASLEELERGYRSEQVAAAKAEVERARSEAVRAGREYERVHQPATEGVYSRQERDNAEAAWRAAAAVLQAEEERHAELRAGYRPEEIEAARASWRRAQAILALRERGSREEDIAFARAALLEAETRYEERQVVAPAAAIVEVFDIRPGDLLAPSSPVATLLEADQLYVKVYVPETELGRVRLGQPAQLSVDSFPQETFPGKVERIHQRAEFLPRNVQTVAERVHQMFAVEVRVEDPAGRLRAGMAATVRLAVGVE